MNQRQEGATPPSLLAQGLSCISESATRFDGGGLHIPVDGWE